ncbi:ion transporter [Kitasatospora sp. NPDC017646]|uniref:ion transporter n=1 Tax=Kitasatospora sp. NPDC017646 TaxID=3364024 RepID=UPI0037AE9A32
MPTGWTHAPIVRVRSGCAAGTGCQPGGVGEAPRRPRSRAVGDASGMLACVDGDPAAERRPGEPRSARDAAFLTRFDAAMQLPILVSAVLPFVIVPQSSGVVGVVVGIATWLVFLVDYVVHVRHVHRFGRTRPGCLDLFVLVATAPWFLLPGASTGRFAVVLRLARLARLVMASRGARHLFEQLGRVAVVAIGIVLVGSLTTYRAEHAVNPEFATVGDALWWGIVTLTTVGYGDIVPETLTGRWVAAAIMVTGIAVLGVLAGALASFFRLDPGGTASEATGGSPSPTATPDSAALEALTEEVAALRRQVVDLAERLAVTRSEQPPDGFGDGH